MSKNLEAWKKNLVELIPRVSLRPAEAAEALGVSERTLSDWAKEDGFPILRIGGVRLIPTNELRQWLTDQIKQKEGIES